MEFHIVETWIHLECDFAEPLEAKCFSKLLECLANSTDDIAEELLTDFTGPGPAMDMAKELHGRFRESFHSLQHVSVNDLSLRANWVTGWDAEGFALGLARFTSEIGARLDRLTAQYDEEILVCDVSEGKLKAESFDDFDQFQECGFLNPTEYPLHHGQTSKEMSGVPLPFVGRWSLNAERTLNLLEEKITSEWDNLSKFVQTMVTPLDEYIGKLRHSYSRYGERILEISESHITTFQGGNEREKVAYSVAGVDESKFELVEYHEDLGGVLEVYKRLELSDNQITVSYSSDNEIVVRASEKLLVYDRLRI